MTRPRLDHLILVTLLAQIAALIPLFSMAVDVGRAVERIEHHEKRLDRLEDQRARR